MGGYLHYEWNRSALPYSLFLRMRHLWAAAWCTFNWKHCAGVVVVVVVFFARILARFSLLKFCCSAERSAGSCKSALDRCASMCSSDTCASFWKIYFLAVILPVYTHSMTLNFDTFVWHFTHSFMLSSLFFSLFFVIIITTTRTTKTTSFIIITTRIPLLLIKTNFFDIVIFQAINSHTHM